MLSCSVGCTHCDSFDNLYLSKSQFSWLAKWFILCPPTNVVIDLIPNDLDLIFTLSGEGVNHICLPHIFGFRTGGFLCI